MLIGLTNKYLASLESMLSQWLLKQLATLNIQLCFRKKGGLAWQSTSWLESGGVGLSAILDTMVNNSFLFIKVSEWPFHT